MSPRNNVKKEEIIEAQAVTKKRNPRQPKVEVVDNKETAMVLVDDDPNNREAPAASRQLMKVASILMPIMNESQMSLILDKTPDYALKHRPGRGGKTFTYVTYGYVVAKLNQAFGFDWDFKLMPNGNGDYFKLTEVTEDLWDNKKREFVPHITRNISVYGELTVRIRNAKHEIIATIVKPGVGSQNWESTVEYGDACKGAKSDALKVAAHELGIGLDLYWNDHAELREFEKKSNEAEEAARALAAANAVQSAPPTPVSTIDPNTPPETPMELLLKSMTKFGLDGAHLTIKLGCNIPELMSWDKVKVGKAWEKLIAEAGNAQGS